MAKTTDGAVKLGKLVAGVKTSTPGSGSNPDTQISNPLTSYFNSSINNVRAARNIADAIKTLARIHPESSQTVSTITRLAHTELRCLVYDSAHQLNPDGSNLLRTIKARMSVLSDYTYGFDDRMAPKTAEASLLRYCILSGAASAELVLDKARLPFRTAVVDPTTVKFKTGTENLGSSYKVVPYQEANGETIDLNVPTFFFEYFDPDVTSAYPVSPLEAAVNIAIRSGDTLEDMTRALKRSGHSRIVAKILLDELLKHVPSDIRADPDKMAAWVEKQRSAVASELENLSPEAALVVFSNIDVSYLNSSIGGTSDYKSLVEVLDGIMATALKIPLSALGKRSAGGSQNTSSTESLLYLKMAAGLHVPTEAVLSALYTLAIRLYGFQGYVVCKFTPIDLRPEIELEAFHAMRQARILELLSIGFYTDEEAAELLGTGPLAPGAPQLSGTFFYKRDANSLTTPSPNGDPARSALTPATPSKPSGGG